MDITVARYTFSSWLRKGLSNRITDIDHLGSGTSPIKERSHIPIDVSLNTQTIHKEIALLGPGDIIGINPQIVVRTEPLTWVTNFEPNYLAFIEFYDEDFLWRYTPAQANGQRLRPWLALLVLEQGSTPEESEFTKNERRLPLPSVTVKAKESLPPDDQTWAWGHVHTNEGYDSATEFEKFLLSLHELNNPNADKIISRLMSPRKLKANTAYSAFVVPAFETGRLAGLGQDPSDVESQKASWSGDAGNLEFPIYYEWYFRTGENEDFESLVKLLEPRPIDKRVGRRDMDGSEPGFGTTVGTDIGLILPATDNQAIIGLEGALKSPETKSKPDTINTAKPFFAQLRAILNFPEQLRKQTNSRSDPVVSPPIYGENHALQHEIDPAGSGWLNELNRDPRDRVPAGFGVKVVQKHQEDYVARAWTQVKNVLSGNQFIRSALLGMTAIQAIHNNFVQRLQPAELFTIFAPVMKKVKGSPTTLFHQLENSTIPSAAVDTALRRLIRPRGAYGRRLQQADPSFSHTRLINDLNEGHVSAAPPKKVPDSLITDKRFEENLPVSKLPQWLKLILKYRLWILMLLLILLMLVAFFSGAWLVCIILAIVVMAAHNASASWAAQQRVAEIIQKPGKVLTEIKEASNRPVFHFTVADPVVPIVPSSGTEISTDSVSSSNSPNALHFSDVTVFTRQGPSQDSLEAKNFRQAATRLYERLEIKAPERVVKRFEVDNAKEKLLQALNPTVAFPKLVAAHVHFNFDPSWLLDPQHLIPAMAYPDFPDPMYEKLRDISTELFLPNLQLIPPNTISLLVTNPPFIESYMVGLNHEFGRELLWREYPTDQRGSYFRQFWEVKGIIAEDNSVSPEKLADRYKDIIPLDQWPSASSLGAHRSPERPQGKQLVLMVRGELLKKYPNTIVYAQKAHIYRDRNGTPDPTQLPVIVEVKTADEMKSEIQFPLFRAEIDPDMRFFGFDLSIKAAKGAENPTEPEDDWGWYFIIQQMPGEPRFGMDVVFSPDTDASTPITWDDLSWDKFAEGLNFIDTSSAPVPAFFDLLTATEKDQWGSHSADMAFILYQKPVMIAVHAREMLENLSE